MSTSNHLEADTVIIETSESVVFTVEIKKKEARGDPSGEMGHEREEEEEVYALPIRSETV